MIKMKFFTPPIELSLQLIEESDNFSTISELEYLIQQIKKSPHMQERIRKRIRIL